MNKRNEQLQTMRKMMPAAWMRFKAFWDAPLEKAICFSGCAENMHTHFIAERQDRVPDWCCDRLSI